MSRRSEFAFALLLDLLGSAAALLIANREWQTAVTSRSRPFADDVLPLTGYTLDSAPTALALVALSGVVAMLATGGIARRAVGGVLALTGGLLVWRSLGGLGAIDTARARSLLEAKHSGVGVDPSVVPHLTVHPHWPVLSAACGLLVCVAGVAVAARGHRWAAMSTRYDAPSSARPPAPDTTTRARADASMWADLDRGTDPTTERGPEPP
ncbi:MAG: Trp biosynthesis-associated membrane protein [Jatrophihabitantaceae bacterium]